MIELTFLKELMLIRQPNVCNRCHDYQLLKKKNANYHCIIRGIGKSEAINLTKY